MTQRPFKELQKPRALLEEKLPYLDNGSLGEDEGSLSFICRPADLHTSFGDKVILVTVERYFYLNYGEKLSLFGLKQTKNIKSAKKYLSTVTKITLSQKEVSRSYLFCAILIFGNKSKLSARLD